MSRNLLIDIDGTICDDISNENSHLYPDAKVIEGALERILHFKKLGDTIYYFTAREEKDRAVTLKWLEKNGFPVDGLIMGKPRSNGKHYCWIDNVPVQGIHFRGNWSDV